MQIYGNKIPVSVDIRKESNSHRIGVEHQHDQHGRRFIVLEHQ